jgi:hypothetical protein
MFVLLPVVPPPAGNGVAVFDRLHDLLETFLFFQDED